MQKSGDPRQAAHDLLERVMERAAWVPAAAAAVLSVASGIVLATIGDLSTGAQIGRLVVGIALATGGVVTGLLVDNWHRKTEAAQQHEVTQAYVALSHAIQPLSAQVAAAANLPLGDRKAKLEPIVTRAVGGLLLLFKTVSGARAVAYKISDDRSAMIPICHLGRHDEPRELRKNDGGRGDRAFKLLETGQPEFIHDTVAASRASDNGYRTYVSVPIRSGKEVHGLLNLDAPNVGDLSEADVSLVRIIANIAAIAFANANRR